MTLCPNSYQSVLSQAQCWCFSSLIKFLLITVLFHPVFFHTLMNVSCNCCLNKYKKVPENPVTMLIAFILLISYCESLLFSLLLNLSSYVIWLCVLKSFLYSPSCKVPCVIIGWVLSIGFEPKLSFASEMYRSLGSLSVPIKTLSFLPSVFFSAIGCVPQLVNYFP